MDKATSAGAGGIEWQFHAGDRLRKARELAGYDASAFSAITGLDRATIRKWERRSEVAPRVVLNLYKMSTTAPPGWLETGTAVNSPDGGPTPGKRRPSKREVGSSNLPEGTFRLLDACAA